jgi:predicted MFS family arabinose efflux permease
VGLFFSIQTACMIVIRLLGSHIFDTVNKVVLIRVCYCLTGLGFGLVYLTSSQTVLALTALVLGLGMGLGVPSLNALMFGLSEPRFRGVNANMMMTSLHLGNFLGPLLGSFSVNRLGYDGFLLVGVAANAAGLGLSLYFTRRRVEARAGS